ncbi:MAG: DUF1569 domain-containing protein [Planctomycetales bacterium]|nr:DUF1569 domain-containing protein [Planctomycetales bacterium]
MPVNTKKVAERRSLVFTDVHQIVADAQQVVSGPFHTSGNWSAGQIFMHLARAVDSSIDGLDVKIAFPVRIVGRYFLKRRILEGTMPAGFRLSGASAEKLVPGETETAAGLKGLREAIARLDQTSQRVPHAVFGPLTKEEWDRLHCRHAEMHLSFIIPHE